MAAPRSSTMSSLRASRIHVGITATIVQKKQRFVLSLEGPLLVQSESYRYPILSICPRTARPFVVVERWRMAIVVGKPTQPPHHENPLYRFARMRYGADLDRRRICFR